MQVEVKIDADAVQQQLVQSITNSAIGKEIGEQIDKALEGSGHYRRNIVADAVEIVLRQQIREVVIEAFAAQRDKVRAQILEKLTDEIVGKMVDAAWAVMEGRIKAAGY